MKPTNDFVAWVLNQDLRQPAIQLCWKAYLKGKRKCKIVKPRRR
jgi:hypothetical protein